MALLSDRASVQGSVRDAVRECCPDGTGPKQKKFDRSRGIGVGSYAGPSRQLSVEELPSDLNPCPLQPNLSTKSSALIDQVTQFDV